MRILGAFLLLGFSNISSAHATPAIAIIIDDMGYDLASGRQALALPGAVTYAFLPGTPHTPTLAREAYAKGKEAMVHLPMEALNDAPLGPGGLTQAMSALELRKTVLANLHAVPHAKGANNHMGSLLTGHPEAMRIVMGVINEAGDYYFVDSRTNEHSVAQMMAEVHGLPATRRHVFLDNQRDQAYITGQFKELLQQARIQGYAVAIGHPYPETIAVLRRELPLLAAAGLGLLPVSVVIQHKTRRSSWHVSSSLSPLAAKSSKQ